MSQPSLQEDLQVRGGRVQISTCLRCESPFEFKPRKRYCSDRCQRIASKRRERDRNTERAVCKGCGLGFQRPKGDGNPKVYCSTSCQYEARSREYRQRDDIGPKGLLGGYYAALRNDPCPPFDEWRIFNGANGDLSHSRASEAARVGGGGYPPIDFEKTAGVGRYRENHVNHASHGLQS